jgi:hypothetical protein
MVAGIMANSACVTRTDGLQALHTAGFGNPDSLLVDIVEWISPYPSSKYHVITDTGTTEIVISRSYYVSKAGRFELPLLIDTLGGKYFYVIERMPAEVGPSKYIGTGGEVTLDSLNRVAAVKELFVTRLFGQNKVVQLGLRTMQQLWAEGHISDADGDLEKPGKHWRYSESARDWIYEE